MLQYRTVFLAQVGIDGTDIVDIVIAACYYSR